MPSKGLEVVLINHRKNNIKENSETGHILRGYIVKEERKAKWEN